MEATKELRADLTPFFFVDPFFLRTGVPKTSLAILTASCSIATWPFYVLLALMLLIVRAWVL